MKFTRSEAEEYIKDRFHVEDMTESEYNSVLNSLLSLEHKPWCRTHMAAIMPNYGSDCTC